MFESSRNMQKKNWSENTSNQHISILKEFWVILNMFSMSGSFLCFKLLSAVNQQFPGLDYYSTCFRCWSRVSGGQSAPTLATGLSLIWRWRVDTWASQEESGTTGTSTSTTPTSSRYCSSNQVSDCWQLIVDLYKISHWEIAGGEQKEVKIHLSAHDM